MDSITLTVEGYNVNAVTKALKRTKGVRGVATDLASNEVFVSYDETQLQPTVLHRVVAQTRLTHASAHPDHY